MPEEWRKSVIYPIHKKGDKLKCENYGGISLLCVSYKIFSGILARRIVPYTEKILGGIPGWF